MLIKISMVGKEIRCGLLMVQRLFFGDDLLGGNDVQKTMWKISDALKRHVDDKQSLVDVLYHACKDVESEYRHTISGYDFIEKYKLPTFAIQLLG